jgi:protein-tyrosine phosphatase
MDRIRVVFVCLGNICRSPLGEGLFRHKVEQAGLDHLFEIDSSGTSAYHVGELPDPGSIGVARKHGIDLTSQRSRQFVANEVREWDYVIAMDDSNRRNILRLIDHDVDSVRGKLWLMRNFEFQDDGTGDEDGVPDPWGGGRRGFDDVYDIVDRSCTHLLTYIRRTHEL